MPIYMDFHDLPEITIEDSRKAHLKDLSVQDKYHVRYLQYWINEQDGKAYCLMEGPNKEACEATHLEANGITACNLVEVKGGMYDLFLGDNQKIDHGLVRHMNGDIDNGYRFIMTLELQKPQNIPASIYNRKSKLDQLRPECIGIVEKYHGRDINQTEENKVTGVFRTPEAALNCSLDLRSKISRAAKSLKLKALNFKMGICVGQPVTAHQGFFEESIKFSRLLCDISDSSKITVSRFFCQLSNLEHKTIKKSSFRIIETPDGDFLKSLGNLVQKMLHKEKLSVDFLGRELGISRAQLYRKTKYLTGVSPNHFIRNQRLNKGMLLLKEGNLNISEVAFDIGFNNPSYFSKCFQNRFGMTPSKVR
jgi:AraC-like DNA-binding protein